MTLPKGDGPFPAVIILTGSGQQDRDQTIFGHKPFLVLADYLTQQGIVVMRADDRGVGGTTGNPVRCTTQDFAGDALAGLNYLKTRKEIDPAKIGLIGHSEGGMIATIAANQSGDVAYIVMLAGPGANMGDIVSFQRTYKMQQMGVSNASIEIVNGAWHEAFTVIRAGGEASKVDHAIDAYWESLSEADRAASPMKKEQVKQALKAMQAPWWRFALAFNPAESVKAVKCPVLALIGEKDTQVPPEMNVPILKNAFEAGGNADATVRIMPGLNHLFQTAGTGDSSEYGEIEETIAPVAMEAVSEWILERVK